MELTISIVVCTHRRHMELERCLRSIAEIDSPVPFDVIVADSDPDALDNAKLAEKFGAKYVISPVRGVSRARNIGWNASASAIVAYIDDDMIVHRHWMQHLIRAFGAPEVMLVNGPMLDLHAAVLPPSELEFVLAQSEWGGREFRIDQRDRFWFEITNFGGLGDGNYALRRAAVSWSPVFEESLGRGGAIAGGEDHYLFFRILERGGVALHVPGAMVFHPNRYHTLTYRTEALAESLAYFGFLLLKHPEFRSRILRYLVQSFTNKRRPWRIGPPAHSKALPTVRVAVAVTRAARMFGSFIYEQVGDWFRSRLPLGQITPKVRKYLSKAGRLRLGALTRGSKNGDASRDTERSDEPQA